VKTRTLFIFNLIASLFYLGTHQFFPEIISNIVLSLINILFLYTSVKIKLLNNNSYTMSRIFISMACIALIGIVFRSPTNMYFYSLLLLTVVLGIEAYELLIKNKQQSF